MTPLENVLERLEGARRVGKGYQALCPAHEDRKPSLAVVEAQDGRVLVRCHAGCRTEDVVAELGLDMPALFPSSNGNGHDPVVEAYVYEDEHGSPLFRVHRTALKRFWQERADGAGGWERGLGATRRVLYRLPKVLEAARRGERIWLVEGERDVHALEKLGEAASTSPGGAGKWRREFSECLRGAQVVVVADRDDAGRKHAREVAASVEGIATSVDLVEPVKGKDISDHLGGGCPLGELIEVERAPEPLLAETDCTTREKTVVQSNGDLPFAPLSAALANAPEEPEWRWRGYLAPGVIALLAGRPKVGKSTLLFGLIDALLAGRPFLDQPTRPTGVLVLSEEREGTLKEKATRFGLDGHVHLLMRHQLGQVGWREAVAEARAYCHEHGLGVLVVDTFAAWAGLKGDEETKPGPVLEALQPLSEAAGDGLAVLLVAHQRKAGGAYGEAVRGSNALAGGVDVVVELERPPSDAQAEGKARVLHAVSRYSGTPDELACVLDEDGYQACGDVGSLREDGEKVRLRQLLRDDGEATVAELADGAELTAATARRRLDDMAAAGEVEREGTGKRGDPYRFRPRLLIAPPPTPRVVQSVESDVGRLATPEEEAEADRIQAKLEVLEGGAS
jgi:5S rRNA maturation endonuclease (ribonuclease M5)